MEKAQDLQQMLNSIITVSEVESTGYPRNWSIYWSVWMGFCF
ncbi:Rz1 family lipoprotein [Escherichia coli]